MPEDKPSVDHEHLATQWGIEFVFRFYRLFKGSLLYDRKNAIIDRLCQECRQLVNSVIQSEGSLFLKIVRDIFFLNNIRIAVRADKYPIVRSFLQEMRKRRIGEVEFSQEVREEDLRDFIYLLSGLEENNESNYLYVKKQLEYRDISGITVGKLESFKDEEIYVDSEDRKRYSKEVYFKTLQSRQGGGG